MRTFWRAPGRALRVKIRIVLAVFLFFLPWLMSLIFMKAGGQEKELTEETASTNRDADPNAQPDSDIEIETEENQGNVEERGKMAKERRILLERDGVRTYLSLEAYLPGMVICEIDPFVEAEALKCQAVIARTYLCRLIGEKSEIEESQLAVRHMEMESRMGKMECRVGDQKEVGYEAVTQAQRERIAEGMARCRQAVRETEGLVITYENQYILPMFHCSSAGRTRDGGDEYPYLRPVESRWDKESPEWQTTYSWSPEEFSAKICQIEQMEKEEGGENKVLVPEVLAEKIQIVKRDQSGYVEWIQIGNRTYEGETVRAALNLPSACFSIGKAADNGEMESSETGGVAAWKKIRAIVNGSGHGYGLSQAGAEHMAREGWGYEEILNYYYTGTQLTRE